VKIFYKPLIVFVILFVFTCIFGTFIDAFDVERVNKFITMFGPFTIAYVAYQQYKLAQKQLDLSREQRSLTERQADIAGQQAQTAKENKEIADAKLKLEKFEKRYEVFNSVISFYINCAHMDKTPADYFYRKPTDRGRRFFLNRSDLDNLQKAMNAALDDRRQLDNELKKTNAIISKARFLFDESIYYEFLGVLEEGYRIATTYNDNTVTGLNNVSSYLKKQSIVYPLLNTSTIDAKTMDEIKKFERYVNIDLPKILSDYLNIDK
jgi:hypothetical protein